MPHCLPKVIKKMLILYYHNYSKTQSFTRLNKSYMSYIIYTWITYIYTWITYIYTRITYIYTWITYIYIDMFMLIHNSSRRAQVHHSTARWYTVVRTTLFVPLYHGTIPALRRYKGNTIIGPLERTAIELSWTKQPCNPLVNTNGLVIGAMSAIPYRGMRAWCSSIAQIGRCRPIVRP